MRCVKVYLLLAEFRLYSRNVFQVPKGPKEARVFRHERLHGFRTDHECYEVMLKGVSKGKALEDYCVMKGLTLDDAYAFGDTSNDVAMLKVSHGVCLANGTKDAMDVSEYITDKRCEEGGFADFVNKFFYNEKSE